MGLKGITIETPPQAEAHINAADDRAIWEAVIGMDGVVNVGQKLKATLISNNLLRVYDGTLVVGGAVGRIPFGEYEDITINNGTQNQLRNDLVVAQIEANGAIENMKLHYIQGVPGEVAKDPDYTVGNVYEGETLRQYPLYRVKLNGLNVEAVEPLFEVLPNLGKVKDEVGELNRKLLPWDAWRQSFLGTHIYRLQFGDINGNIIQTNQLSIPWLPSEVTVALSKINIPGAGTIAIDYKSAYLTTEGGLYIYCSTAGAAGVASLKWQVVDATIVIQRK